jgi:hypothetical protein
VVLLVVGATVLVGCPGGGGSKDAVEDIKFEHHEALTPPDAGDAGEQGGQPEAVETKDLGVEVPPGYLEFCVLDADCAGYGLACYAEGPDDPKAFCSKPCESNADCPGMLVCKPKVDKMVCQLGEFCDYCEKDEQCGADEDHRCVKDKTGQGFCSMRCKKDKPETCAAGTICKKAGLGLEDYFCFPMFGVCKGDGTHCTPCQSDADCLKGLVCHENSYTFERYCAEICQVKSNCPKGFGCYELMGEKLPLCTLEVDGEPTETCYKENKAFCDPCMKNYECQLGVCYNYAVANKFFCTFPCDKEKYKGEGCPSGLFCAPNYGETGGMVCIPPTSWGCQGFLNCLGVDCEMGEKCVDGFCQPK